MIEGILPLWKEKGMTSFGCVRKVRQLIGIKKVGHAGTLDPDVEGILPIAIGSATKVLEFMLEGDKAYTGEVTLGFSTSTEDASGEVIEKKEVTGNLDETTVDTFLDSVIGKIEQTPPMYSAVKVAGKRLYEYAFEGLEVERPSREVEIYDIKRTSSLFYDEKAGTLKFTFDVDCSKGTYIRTLAVMIGERLGYPAHMSKLTRIRTGNIKVDQTVTLKELESLITENRLDEVMLPIDYALDSFSSLIISENLWKKVKNGALLHVDEVGNTQFPILFRYSGAIVALYDKHPTKINMLKPKKMFKTEL